MSVAAGWWWWWCLGVGGLPVCCFCAQWRKDWRKFLVQEEHWLGNHDPIAPCLPLNYHETCPLWELHTSGVGFELPHDKTKSFPHRFSSHVLLCLPSYETGSPVDSSPSPLQHFSARPCSIWWIFHRAEETALLLLARPILRLGPSSRYLSPSEMIVSVCLGREWWAYRIRSKRSAYSSKSYTVSFSSGIQGKPGFHLGYCCCRIATTAAVLIIN